MLGIGGGVLWVWGGGGDGGGGCLFSSVVTFLSSFMLVLSFSQS